MSAHEWEKRTLAEALARFEAHRIVESTGSSWSLRAPKSSNLWYVVTVHHGRVVVDGDVDPVGFVGGDGWKDPAKYVEWIGKHTDDIHYAAGKAGLWWGSSRSLVEREPAVALYDLGEMLRVLDEELAPVEGDDDDLGPAREAARRVDNGDDIDDVLKSLEGHKGGSHRIHWSDSLRDRALIREALERVADHEDVDEVVRTMAEDSHSADMEVVGGIGEVVARRVIVGVAALAHLHRLLTTKDGAK